MTNAEADDLEEEVKPSKLPLILALVALLAGGAGGFYATFSGMLLAPETDPTLDDPGLPMSPLPEVAYLPLEPLVVSVGKVSDGRHLRFSAQLEVQPDHRAAVEKVMPRIVDVLNGYLRALTIEDLDKPAALVTIRAHMLSRIQTVAGFGRVTDFLVMEFVLN